MGPFRAGLAIGLARKRRFASSPWRRYASSRFFAASSIAASDLRTWLRSVVYQKSGSDAFR